MTVLDHAAAAPPLPDIFARWFASRGWTPRAHQLELLAKARAGRSVLLIAPTGAGKTLAGFLPSLVELSGGVAHVGLLPRRLFPPPLRGRGGGEWLAGEPVILDPLRLVDLPRKRGR